MGHVSFLHVPAVSFKASKLTRTRYPYGCCGARRLTLHVSLLADVLGLVCGTV